MLDTKKLLQLLEYYEKGAITGGELVYRIFQGMNSENVELVMPLVPDEFKMQMFDIARTAPLEDEEWGRTFCIECVVYSAGFRHEDYERRQEENKRLYRQGIQALRDFLDLDKE
jgi:hypothetical protein